MSVFVADAANDITSAALQYFARGPAMSQTMQKKPLLGFLRAGQKTFPGGKDNVVEHVKGTYMSSVAGFFSGYSEDTAVTFTQSQNVLDASYPWKEVHAGLVITWTELKKDGISIVENGRPSEHSEVGLTRLVGLLDDRLKDFAESWARAKNSMLWNDGTQDADQVPGIQALLPLNNTTGTVGGLAMATYAFWRHIVRENVGVSPQNQTLTEQVRADLIQLNRYGGEPNKAFCGSEFLAALRSEVSEKGLYTQRGFEQGVSFGMGDLSVQGLGVFTYDPTLDDLDFEKRCYAIDGRRLRLRPMEGEDNKTITPERPYNYMVFLKSMTWTGALEVTQMNAHAIWTIA